MRGCDVGKALRRPASETLPSNVLFSGRSARFLRERSFEEHILCCAKIETLRGGTPQRFADIKPVAVVAGVGSCVAEKLRRERH